MTPEISDVVLRRARAFDPRWLRWAEFAALAAFTFWYVSPLGLSLNVKYYLPLIVIAVMYFASTYTRRGELKITGAGICYLPNVPKLFEFFDSPWQVSWNDLLEVRWASTTAPTFQLNLVLRNRSHRSLWANTWFPDLASARAGRKVANTLLSGDKLREKSLALPLVQILITRGYRLDQSAAASGSIEFDLAKSPASIKVLFSTLALFAVWFVDVMVSDQMYVGNEPWVLFAIVGVASAGLTFGYLIPNRIPHPHAGFLAFLLGATVGLSSHAGLLRANQWLDKGGPHAVSFTLEPDGSLRSDVREVPHLPPDFFGNQLYWRNQKQGSTHTFKYNRGVGITSLDIEEYRLRLSGHYGFDPGRTNFKTNR